MTRGRGRSRDRAAQKARKQRLDTQPETAEEVEEKRKRDRAAAKKRRAASNDPPPSISASRLTGTCGNGKAAMGNTSDKPVAGYERAKRRSRRGKGDPTRKAQRRKRNRAAKAAREASEMNTKRDAHFDPASDGALSQSVESDPEIRPIQESVMSMMTHERASTKSQPVLLDISGYRGYDEHESPTPTPLRHLRRLASLIPRQEYSPPTRGSAAEDWRNRNDYQSCLVAKSIDDFCAYVDHLLHE
ncbi:hypothetical protein BGZ57DRAFT_961489 [Hyaloscypha finlandica]|nr:hypothetical protein BGZ57DRAFT_961489 [Hyaloscypha finlandica]